MANINHECFIMNLPKQMECFRFLIELYAIRRVLNLNKVEYQKQRKVIFIYLFRHSTLPLFETFSESGTYTEMREKREEFRKKLVALIMTDNEQDDEDDFPNSSERRILKYYHYIRHGIDTVHVAPMHKKMISK